MFRNYSAHDYSKKIQTKESHLRFQLATKHDMLRNRYRAITDP